MKKSHLLVYILFLVSAFIVLLNRYSAFYLSDYRLHFLFLFCAAASFVIITGHFLFNKLKSGRSMLVTFLIVGALCFAKGFFTWGGDWKTQTVLFESIADHNRSVDYQLCANRFSFGYKKRVVGVYRLAPGMQWVTDADTAALDSRLWKRVNIAANEPVLPAGE